MNVNGSIHITKENRYVIYKMLLENQTLNEIAREIKKDPRAVSREIRNHRLRSFKEKAYGRYSEAKEQPCKRCSRYPFVCEGCKHKFGCRYLVRFKYSPDYADDQARRILRDSRKGINLTPDQFKSLDNRVFQGVNKGQSLNHIYMHAEEFEVSLRSAYRYVENRILSTTSVDLRRKIRFRKRVTPKKSKLLVDSETRRNRLYSDYIRFKAHHPGVAVVQMDVVESGKPFKPCLLTLHFIDLRFMLAFWLPEKKPEHISKVFTKLQNLLTVDEYKKLFPVVLTDRGTEFSNPLAIEFNHQTGEKVSNVFFCDPQASNQKAQIEENHSIVRYVIPKSSNIGLFNQDDIDLLLSHVNSYGRAVIGTTPYELFKIYFEEEILNKIKVKFIQPDLVYLKPDLFHR